MINIEFTHSVRQLLKRCTASMLILNAATLPFVYLLSVFFLQSAVADSINNKNEHSDFANKLALAAIERTKHFVIYNGRYRKIKYPGGDVPQHLGVCTDVVIRAYRSVGIDLQQDVHNEMQRHFDKFPTFWGLKKPDSNIDHRRVPNLQVLFKRKGTELPVTNNAHDYQTGDLVTWVVGGNRPHIGIVVEKFNAKHTRPLIVHNIGWGPKMEDMLFDYPITGHYRYFGSH